MASYNVMITEANSKLGMEFVRQLLALPHPPEHIFAAYMTEENSNDLIKFQEGSIKSTLVLCGINSKLPIEDGIGEFKTKVRQVIGNNGLDLVINLICFTNNKRDLTISDVLENQFQESLLPTPILFQIMLPLLEDAALRNRECNEESKSVFFNVIQDDSNASTPISEINKVALNLTMDTIAEKVKNNIIVLSSCLNLYKRNEKYDTEIEKCVSLNLLHAFCSSWAENSKITESSTVY